MNLKEKQMLDLLKDLKENHNVIGVKAEFEAEGTRLNEMINLCQIIHKADSELFLKIGGCEAVSDLDMARHYGVSGIISPMIESSFAFRKFIESAQKVFTKEELDNIKLMINIETITACTNLDAIIADPTFSLLFGITFGRNDMASSLNLQRADVDSKQVFDICKDTLVKIKQKNLICGIGGVLSMKSMPFLENLGKLADRTETRKIIFDITNGLDKVKTGLVKAFKFECLYLQNLSDLYGRMSKENLDRINTMQNWINEIN